MCILFEICCSGNGNTHNYAQCKKIVEQFFNSITYNTPKDLHNQEIVAFSYIYDIALKAKLVGGMLKF